MSDVISIKVTPRAAKRRVQIDESNNIKVYVTASPTDGEANKAVCELLAKVLSVPKTSIQIVSGHTSREKKLAFDSLSSDEVVTSLKEKLLQKKLF
jgi:uncharacterized protein (TIGR00251 family)